MVWLVELHWDAHHSIDRIRDILFFNFIVFSAGFVLELRMNQFIYSNTSSRLPFSDTANICTLKNLSKFFTIRFVKLYMYR